MGLTGTPAAFARGFEAAGERQKEKRLHQYQLEDEERQNNVKDWFEQRSAIRDRAKKLNLQGDDLKAEEDKVAALTAKINDAYHPAKAPGALQKDWHFLKGLLRIHGKGEKPAAAPPTIAGGKTPDITIQPLSPEETVKLGADTPTPTPPPTTDAGATQTAQSFASLPQIPGLAANLNPMVHAAHAMYPNVPPALTAAVIGQESSGKAGAVNPVSGATGLMQLMPETAKMYGVTDATNPLQNIMAGTHYLSDLMKKHGGDPAEALKDYYGRGKAPAGYPTTSKYADDVLGAYQSILGKMPKTEPAAATPTAPAAAPAATPAAPAQPGAAALSPFEQIKMQTMPGAKEMDITLPSSPITIPGTTQPTVVGPSSATMAVPPAKVKGLVAAGNLPIWNRPVIQNADGTVSSEYSTSFTDERKDSPYYGKEVLVPTVVNGKFLTPDGKKPEEGSDAEKAMFDAARGQYEKTGQHLGVFEDPKSADKYAQQLHSRGERPQPDAAKYEPKLTKQQKAQQAAKDKAAEEAEAFMAAGPLTSEEEAKADLAKKGAEIDATMDIAKKLMGDNWSEEEQKEFKQSLISTTLGGAAKEKYFSQIVPIDDPVTGEKRYYRVPMSGAPPEEITEFRNKTMVPKAGAGGTKGTDFFKWLVANYGPNPTPQQWAEGKLYWEKLGAKGSETYTDAGGNTYKVPTFMAGQQVPPGLGLTPGETTGGTAEGQPGAGAPGEADGRPTQARPAAPQTPDSPVFVKPDPNDDWQADARAQKVDPNDVMYVANYQGPESDIAASRGGQRSKFMSLVLRANPGYSQAHYKLVSDTISAFGPRGDDGKALKSLNTAIHHVGTMLGKFDALGNGDYPLLNRGKNFVAGATGSPEVVAFNAAAKAVADETGRVFRQSGLTEAEAQAWLSNLNPNMSPAQMQGAIDSIIDLLSGRMIAETTTYKGVMGNLSGFPPLDSEAISVLKGGRTQQRGAVEMLQLDQEARQAAPRSVRGTVDKSSQQAAPAPAQHKGKVSVAQARKRFPQLAGMTDGQVQEQIRQQGYDPVP